MLVYVFVIPNLAMHGACFDCGYLVVIFVGLSFKGFEVSIHSGLCGFLRGKVLVPFAKLEGEHPFVRFLKP